MHTKHELTKAVLPRYLKGNKDEKQKILDEFEAVTGYHRKYAIRKLKKLQMTLHIKENIAGVHIRNRERIYDRYVEAVIEQIYEALGGIGARRIHPHITTVLEK